MKMSLNDSWKARLGLFDALPQIPEDRTPKLTFSNMKRRFKTTTNRIMQILGSFRVIIDVLGNITRWDYGLIPGVITMITFVHVCLNFRLWMLPLLVLVVFMV